MWLLESISPELQPVTDPEKSLLAFLGKGIAPVFAPCGFSFWQAAVALLAGLPAKENIAGTLAVLLPGAALTVSFSPLSGLSFLIFVLLYSPCAAALSAYKKEAGSLHRAIGMAVSQSLLAWAVSALFSRSVPFFFKERKRSMKIYTAQSVKNGNMRILSYRTRLFSGPKYGKYGK